MKEIEEKANYCLSCKTKPCQKGCPLQNDITEFIHYMKEKEYEKAYEELCKTTVLQPICGRICPHKKQCEGSCIRGIKAESVEIGQMEAAIGDLAIQEGYKIKKFTKEKKDKKVAIIGGGPAGLTAAANLARNGYRVVIYEKYQELGGILAHGIPEFRLPKEIVTKTIQKILELGIEVKYGEKLGRTITLSELQKQYDAIFLAFGANCSMKMNIPGEELKGVYGGNELLEEKKYPELVGKKVSVIGGGNVAMDTARSLKRMGAKEVYVIYRRAEEQMPAERKEIQEAKEEGIQFLFQNNIIAIKGKDKVEEIECIKTELIQKEGEIRKVPVNIPNSNYVLEMDYVIMAVGSQPERAIVGQLGLDLTDNGYLKVDQKQQTSEPGIFAGGDLSQTKGTVAWASRAGRDAAEAIKEYLESSYHT